MGEVRDGVGRLGWVKVAGAVQDSIKRRGELAGPVVDEAPELGGAITEIHHQVADLLGGPSAIGVRRRAQQVHGPVSDLEDEETEIRWSLTAQSTGKKSHASIVEPWARRNCRQVVSVSRTGAGGIRPHCRTRRIVDAPTR